MWEADTLGYLTTSSLRLGTDSTEPYNSQRMDTVKDGYRMLAPLQTLFTVNFEDPEDIASLVEGRVFSANFLADTEGEVDCVVGWFTLHLGEDVTLSTGKNLKKRTRFQNRFRNWI